MELRLSSDEQELLAGILERRHRELQTEISHTDHHDFKRTLRRHEKLIESILNQLRAASVEELRA